MNTLNFLDVQNFIKSRSIIDWVKIVSVVIFLSAAMIYFFGTKSEEKLEEGAFATTTSAVSATSSTKVATATKVAPSINVMSKCNFKVVSPAMYSSVSMPFSVKGILDKADTSKGCIWNEQSSRAGEAEIFYNRNGEGWKSAGTAVPIVTGTIPGGASTTVSFTASFNLYTKALGLTSGTPIKIIFTELNIPAKPNPDTFNFQVRLK